MAQFHPCCSSLTSLKLQQGWLGPDSLKIRPDEQPLLEKLCGEGCPEHSIEQMWSNSPWHSPWCCSSEMLGPSWRGQKAADVFQMCFYHVIIEWWKGAINKVREGRLRQRQVWVETSLNWKLWELSVPEDWAWHVVRQKMEIVDLSMPHKEQPSEGGTSGALQGSVSQGRSKVQLLFQGIFPSLQLGMEIKILGNADRKRQHGSQQK